MSYFTYILECSDKTLYCGCTINLDRRVREHNFSKKGAHYTKIRRPVILKYSEKYEDLSSARKREAEIKKLSKEAKKNLF